jgi:glycosyltransferase involved in cell wall biosynthesis
LGEVAAGCALFLDDDDWLLPGHLAGLSQALQAQPVAVAASTGVQCLGGDPHAPVLRHVFEGRADRAAMQLQNALPIHAVLFRVTPETPRFDESLDHFEDWDFWLQLMAKGSFVHVPGVTAVYWLDDTAGSGHASAGPQRDTMLSRFARRRLQNWSADDVTGLITHDVERSQQLAHQQQLVAAQRIEIERLVVDAQALQQQVELVRSAAEDARSEAARLHEQQVEVARSAAEDARSEAARLHAELLDHRRELELHRRELTVLELLRVEHLHELTRLQGEVVSLRASTSWRVTLPLRQLGALGRSLARAGWLTQVRDIATSGRSALRRHGVMGVVRRLPAYLLRTDRLLRSRSANPVQPTLESSALPSRLHPELTGFADAIDAMVSVVIPTLNGGEELVALVRKLLNQQAVREIEVVLVDSGSVDGSADRCEALGARVVRIRPEEFSHSGARNLGADQARGAYLLFMVQDAYPIGDLWIYALLSFLLDHREEGVVAASCAEYSRSDSDAMYDCGVTTHYRFLGCLEQDRIGRHTGDDHMSLRSMGQLSDVACMIARDLFLQYRYRGDYAEDLDLGIRLIQDGFQVAMLASVKVVHSHNRPAWYYLKRSFVDVVFLVGLFKDFESPPCRSIHGLVSGIRQVAHEVGAWLPALARLPEGSDLGAALSSWIVTARHWSPADVADASGLGEPRLEAFIAQISDELAQLQGSAASSRVQADAQRDFTDAFLARLDHFNRYASSVYGPVDPRLRHEYAQAVLKTLAATIGSCLAYWVLDLRRVQPGAEPTAERQWAERLFTFLKSGV